MTTSKITKKMQFTALRDMALTANRSDLVEFIDHELELLAKKNTATKTSPRQAENAELATKFLQFLSDGEKSAQDVMTEFDLTSQRMSAIMADLIESGTVTKSKVKGKVHYTLA